MRAGPGERVRARAIRRLTCGSKTASCAPPSARSPVRFAARRRSAETSGAGPRLQHALGNAWAVLARYLENLLALLGRKAAPEVPGREREADWTETSREETSGAGHRPYPRTAGSVSG